MMRFVFLSVTRGRRLSPRRLVGFGRRRGLRVGNKLGILPTFCRRRVEAAGKAGALAKGGRPPENRGKNTPVEPTLASARVDKNLWRRDLSVGQKTMIGLDIAAYLEAAAKERQIAAGSRGKEGGRGKRKTPVLNRGQGKAKEKRAGRGRPQKGVLNGGHPNKAKREGGKTLS
jgi:hypothetical protein